jgi:hypothetical protein
LMNFSSLSLNLFGPPSFTLIPWSNRSRKTQCLDSPIQYRLDDPYPNSQRQKRWKQLVTRFPYIYLLEYALVKTECAALQLRNGYLDAFHNYRCFEQ